MPVLKLRGLEIHKGMLSSTAQIALVDVVREIAKAAPVFSPMTPYGRPMTVKMTSAGTYGWYSDDKGFGYRKTHPNKTAWPAIPSEILDIWDQVSGASRPPECCLVNFYGQDARMGMHQDNDEANFDYPVVSISLGDEGLLRVGGTTRGGKTDSVWLQSGDVVVMRGAARLAYHGVDRIRFGSSTLLPKSGRINLTLRVVD
ncbi:MAG: alkylated DNA repair protein (DNA oxidative demethylase) [Candidatus Azotimanducaceae bacterium]|jgi:alkylated DNA repair protein (DNA oxidative demethylase)